MVLPNDPQFPLTPEQADFVARCLASGRFGSEREVVAEGLRLLEQSEQLHLLEKWLLDDLTDDERTRINPDLLVRAKTHIQRLIEEGIRSGEEDGWIDSEEAMRALRSRIGLQKEAG